MGPQSVQLQVLVAHLLVEKLRVLVCPLEPGRDLAEELGGIRLVHRSVVRLVARVFVVFRPGRNVSELTENGRNANVDVLSARCV